MRVGLAGAVLAGLAGQVAAHPHVFIDTGLEVIFDAQGMATALRITWAYDDLVSLMIVEDRGMDPDGDGTLTPAEQAALTGFDMAWDADFAGDTHALAGDVPLVLSRPSDWTVDYRDGRVISTHLRRLEPPLRPGAVPLVVQVYDPGFYSAYAIAGTPVLTGAAPECSVQVFEPDRAAADAILQAAIDEYTGDAGIEGDFPAVGAAYSEEARITCAGGS
ncbi:DUF1007 family protein [Paracoccaceae bacterium Fryx2]|nr:DUF1007 family protein [Paracoccaceae bacterium Fryx2]